MHAEDTPPEMQSLSKNRNNRKHPKMKPLSTKQMTRIEKKKKKMAALVEIAKLNARDRDHRSSGRLEVATDNFQSVKEPSPKRLRTEEICEDVATVEPKIQSTQGDEIIKQEGNCTEEPELSGEEYLKLKKAFKEQSNKFRIQPKLWLRDIGTTASLAVAIDSRIPLFLSDIQHLIMYSLIGHHSPYNPARWCQLDKFSRLLNTCVLIVENVSMYDYMNNEASFPFTNSTFDIKLEFLNPQSYRTNFIQDLIMVPITMTQLKKYLNSCESLQETLEKPNYLFDFIRDVFPVEKDDSTDTYNNLPESDRFSRTQLILSGWQMVEENYPLPIKGLVERKYSNYVLTKDVYERVTSSSPLFGVDCEMCLTTKGDLELTRISIVDEKHQTFYDMLVKPDNPITDYLTKFSGITAKIMKPVTTRLKDVQEDLRRKLPADAILVGQSLSGDLHALKMMHPYVIDTSVIYNMTGERGRKSKLKTLAKEFLHDNIQSGHQGHCSIEDGLASLKLVQLKLTKHLYFGDAVMSHIKDQSALQNESGKANYATSMLRHVTKMEKNASIVGSEDLVDKYSYFTLKDNLPTNSKINFTSAKTNKMVVTKMCTSIVNYSLNIGHVKLPDVHQDKEFLYKEVDSFIQQVYEQSGMPSLNIVLFSGGSSAATGCCFLKIKTIKNSTVSNIER